MIASWARTSSAAPPWVRATPANFLRRRLLPGCPLRAGSALLARLGAGAREIARVLRPAGRCVITTVILPEKARKKMLAKGINAESYAARIRKQNMPFGMPTPRLRLWRALLGFEMARIAYAEKSFVMIAATKAEANEVSNGARNNAVGRGTASTTSVAPESSEILNQWWPVAFEHQLDANGDKLAVSLFGEPLVVPRSRGRRDVRAGPVRAQVVPSESRIRPVTGTSYAATTAGRTATAVRS